ncbi:hypothetical protein ES703_87669 [subsurface metagenome]
MAVGLGLIDQIDGVEAVQVVAPVVGQVAGVLAGLRVNAVIEQAVLMSADLENTVEHFVNGFLISAFFVRHYKIDRGIQLAQPGDYLAAVVVERESIFVFGRMVLAQQVIVAEADGPLKVFPVAGHPVDTGKRLEHFAVDFLVRGNDFSIFGFNGCILPHIIEHPEHTVTPGAWPEPFGQRQQAVFDVLR